ncbi:MAG: hypothetical protein IPH04_15030 [Saprospirales bacterium]|nr:hypothetical protein [Saprospirales bacterium]
MRLILFAAAGLLALSSCQNSAPKTGSHTEEQLATQEQKRLEVMAVHDAVMPFMSDLNRLARQLKPLSQEGSTLGEDEREVLWDVVKRLEQADEGMMSWMGEFQNNLDPMRDSTDHQGVMNYLEAELGKVKEVENQMRSSMQDGEAMVVKYGLTESN